MPGKQRKRAISSKKFSSIEEKIAAITNGTSISLIEKFFAFVLRELAHYFYRSMLLIFMYSTIVLR